MQELATIDEGFDPNAQKLGAGVRIEFFTYTGPDDKRTREEGRPCFKDYEYLRITVAGDRSNVVERPVNASDRLRFAAQYKNWKANQEQQIPGYPLAQWAALSRADVEELNYARIYTVEQLAEVADTHAQGFRNGLAMKAKAQKFLALLKENAPMEKMAAELAERDEKIKQLETSVAQLLEAAKSKK